MNQEMKKNLHLYTTSLMDSIDRLKMTGSNGNLIAFLSRAANLGNIAILYFSSLDESELDSVVSALNIATSLSASTNISLAEENTDELSRIVESIEELFRDKKLLLDGLGKKSLV